jgi:hypothetical protein
MISAGKRNLRYDGVSSPTSQPLLAPEQPVDHPSRHAPDQVDNAIRWDLVRR